MNNHQIIITFALPYGNGDLHIGHLYEAFLVDIQAKALREQKKDVLTLSATDCHGTPISLSAKKENLSELDYVLKVHEKQKKVLESFEVLPSVFGLTRSAINEENSKLTYKKANEKGYIKGYNKNIPYDPVSNIALFERLIVGICPNCNTKEVKGGDACPQCQNIYNGQDLLEPKSAISGNKPIYKDTEILSFGNKNKFNEIIKNNTNIFSKESLNKIDEWLLDDEQNCSLEISRPQPYWGFSIPKTSLAFAVWWDAPLGYISGIQEYDIDHQTNYFENYKKGNSHLINYIGKDILRFHAFYWLLQLETLDLPLPEKIVTHGFICGEDGKKLSKSEGNYIAIDELLNKFPVAAIKLFLGLNSPKGVNDLSFSEKQIKELWNTIIVGKFANIAFRSSALIEKNYNGDLLFVKDDKFYLEIKDLSNKSVSLISEGLISSGLKLFVEILTKIDQKISLAEPWKNVSDENHYELSLAIESLYETNTIIGLISLELKDKLINFRSQEKIVKPNISWASRI